MATSRIGVIDPRFDYHSFESIYTGNPLRVHFPPPPPRTARRKSLNGAAQVGVLVTPMQLPQFFQAAGVQPLGRHVHRSSGFRV